MCIGIMYAKKFFSFYHKYHMESTKILYLFHVLIAR